MKVRALAILLGLSFAFSAFVENTAPPVNEDSRLVDVLIALGQPAPKHYLAQIDPVQVAIGYTLVHKGKATSPDGKNGSYISTIFVCTDCHNQVKEDPNPASPNPEARMSYAIANNLPFLQATTFWGVVNRESWYNDDYIKKYGEWIAPAKESLYESTQLCARECSSGRTLEAWEAEAINHYYWSLELHLSDLRLKQDEFQRLNKALSSDDSGSKASAIGLLKSKYMVASPANFVDPPTDRKIGMSNEFAGDAQRGVEIFNRSCMQCHRYGGASLFVMDDSKKTKKLFAKNIARQTPFALYDIVRYGTHAEPGHRQYMPLYTLDRMSHQQLEDLRTYLTKW